MTTELSSSRGQLTGFIHITYRLIPLTGGLNNQTLQTRSIHPSIFTHLLFLFWFIVWRRRSASRHVWNIWWLELRTDDWRGESYHYGCIMYYLTVHLGIFKFKSRYVHQHVQSKEYGCLPGLLLCYFLYIYVLYITLGNRVDMAVGCLTEQI